MASFVEVPVVLHDKEEPFVLDAAEDRSLLDGLEQCCNSNAMKKQGNHRKKHHHKAAGSSSMELAESKAGGGGKRKMLQCDAAHQTKRKKLSEILDGSDMKTLFMNPEQDGTTAMKLPPRRAMRKQKRVQLKALFSSSCDQPASVCSDSEMQGNAAELHHRHSRLVREHHARPRAKGKQRSVKMLLSATTMETDHASFNARTSSSPPEPETSQAWREIAVVSINPMELIGRRCKILWPKDNKWYSGTIHEYRSSSGNHLVDYDDNDKEWLPLAKHRVQFRMSTEEESRLKSSISAAKQLDVDELMLLAHDMENCEERIVHGTVVWAKVKGWPMWPALVMDEDHATKCGLQSRNSTLPVQFFGSTDFARINSNKLVTFAKGVQLKLHTKCKRAAFDQALKQVERYLKEGKLPDKMADSIENWSRNKRKGSRSDEEDLTEDEKDPAEANLSCLPKCPIDLGELRIISLGCIVDDSKHFHSKHHIWPEGYTIVRQLPSDDPNRLVDYTMEVLRAPSSPWLPLFRISTPTLEVFEDGTANGCWAKVCEKLVFAGSRSRESGLSMFGFTNPRVAKLIQGLPNASICSKFVNWQKDSQERYRPIEVEWKHAERCNVCYVEEEYVDNLLLQCAKCRIMVHMACYGDFDSSSGGLWLCQLCKLDSPGQKTPCCLCPVTGGVMKRTTDGRWAHLACAMWIPETCLLDVKRMEPVDGLSCISKERWKLVCCICQVAYGASIQCANVHCRVAYHPLCARAAGFSMEIREAGDQQQLQFLSYCHKHGPNITTVSTETVARVDSTLHLSGTKAGCARCEPYDMKRRRGRQEPEAQIFALEKRLFLENTPYMVGGFKKHSTVWRLQRSGLLYRSLCGPPEFATTEGPDVLSVAARFEKMRASLHQRLSFGKSSIHGWGIFTKQPHRAGDIVAEYVGEILRPSVADMREKLQYNSFVGAGTYMFHIDEERVVDATRAGGIAHLINHSCEPNCYSRIITVEGVDHITICAKRDIAKGEELTYDYRFSSKDGELNCNCGSRKCRGSLRLSSDHFEGSRLVVPRSMLDCA